MVEGGVGVLLQPVDEFAGVSSGFDGISGLERRCSCSGSNVTDKMNPFGFSLLFSFPFLFCVCFCFPRSEEYKDHYIS